MEHQSVLRFGSAAWIVWVLTALFVLSASDRLCASGRQTGGDERVVITLHGAVGPVIDEEENQRFVLFGAPGRVIAARVYQQRADRYSLHLLGTLDGQGYLVTRSLGFMDIQSLSDRIEWRVSSGIEADLPPVVRVEVQLELGPERMAVLTLLDKTELNGRVVRVTPDSVVFETAGGLVVPVPENKVLSIEWPQGTMRGGEFIRYDPNSTRLFFAPTGRGLRQGEGYFADYVLVFPTVAFGLSNYVAMSGGISLVPGAETQIAYLAPKISVAANDQTAVGLGLLFAFDIGGEGGVGVAYGVTTFGSPAGGVTLGVGIPFGQDLDNSPLLLIGAETQVSNHAKLITENWIFTAGEPGLVFSGGVRFFGRKLAVDLALVGSPEFFEDGGFPFLPWVDFSVMFGR